MTTCNLLCPGSSEAFIRAGCCDWLRYGSKCKAESEQRGEGSSGLGKNPAEIVPGRGVLGGDIYCGLGVAF